MGVACSLEQYYFNGSIVLQESFYVVMDLLLRVFRTDNGASSPPIVLMKESSDISGAIHPAAELRR
jgi:hypothetical protein